MDEILKTDNLAILSLAAWVAFLIKDRATERAEKTAILELYRQQVEALSKVTEALRRIRHVLQIEQTGEFHVKDFPRD